MVIGTWVGARTPDVHFNSDRGAGSSLALPVVAQIIREIEKDSELTDKYLASFDLPDDVYSFLECDPFRQSGIRGFFNRLFGTESVDKKEQDSAEEIEKEVRSFFERLFRKKK